MATYDLFIDTVAGEFVTGPKSSQIVQPNALKWNYGDTITARIFLLTKVASATIANGFDISPLLNNGLTLQLYFDDGNAATPTVYANQLIWAPSADNTYFTADLALNTAGLLSIITSDQGGTCWLKIGYIQGGKATTVISKKVNISVGLPSAALSVPAGLTPLSVEVANNTYFPLAPVAGQAAFFKSLAGKIVGLRLVDNPDGTSTLRPFTVI